MISKSTGSFLNIDQTLKEFRTKDLSKFLFIYGPLELVVHVLNVCLIILSKYTQRSGNMLLTLINDGELVNFHQIGVALSYMNIIVII